MAIFKPSLCDLGQLVTPLNAGEQCVARALSSLDDGWTIYVQPRIAHDIPDFIAVHDHYGVCAVEVKDWANAGYRQTDDGAIEYRSCESGWSRSTEMPRYQAYRYRSTIFDQFFALPGDNQRPTVAVRAVVVLPQYANEGARKLLARPSVTDDELAIEVWGGDGLKQSIEQIVRGRGCPIPRPESIERVKRHLANVYEKMGVKSRGEAAREALLRDWITIEEVRGPAPVKDGKDAPS